MAHRLTLSSRRQPYNSSFVCQESEIQQRKSNKKGAASDDDVVYDPIAADERETAYKASRQGDKLSGIDEGLSALESLALGPGGDATAVGGGGVLWVNGACSGLCSPG